MFYKGYNCVFSTTIPSSKLMVRVAKEASRWEWVTMTTVVPSAFNCVSRSMTSLPFFESRFPVGSSARTSFGLTTTARAMATRCC